MKNSNVYTTPEAFGLRQIGKLDDPEACFSFNMLVVWQHTDGRVFWAKDSGCSLPSPFEDFTDLGDLNEVTKRSGSWDSFSRAVLKHCLPTAWDGPVADTQAITKVNLLSKVEALIR